MTGLPSANWDDMTNDHTHTVVGSMVDTNMATKQIIPPLPLRSLHTWPSEGEAQADGVGGFLALMLCHSLEYHFASHFDNSPTACCLVSVEIQITLSIQSVMHSTINKPTSTPQPKCFISNTISDYPCHHQ